MPQVHKRCDLERLSPKHFEKYTFGTESIVGSWPTAGLSIVR